MQAYSNQPPQAPYRQPVAPPGTPLHFLPVPRPLPAGAKWHHGDIPALIWVVVLLALGGFATWYAFFYAHYEDMQVGGELAAVAFTVVGILAAIPSAIRRSRRARLLVWGRAVPGTIANVTKVQLQTRQGWKVGAYHLMDVAFEDKIVRLRTSPEDPNPPVFVHGPWAGVYQRLTSNPTPRVEMAKWVVRRR